jgi:hypothetical protein
MRPHTTVLLILAVSLAACHDTGQDAETVIDSGRMEAAEPSRADTEATPLSAGPAAALEGPGSASFTTHAAVDPPDVGVPVYPGAHKLAGGTWQLSDDLDEGTHALTTFALFTPHRLARVVEFYRTRLQLDPAAVFTLAGRAGQTVSITVETRRHSVNLLLRESADPQGTRIEISAMASTPRSPPT